MLFWITTLSPRSRATSATALRAASRMAIFACLRKLAIWALPNWLRYCSSKATWLIWLRSSRASSESGAASATAS